jgi:hypothetical protein
MNGVLVIIPCGKKKIWSKSPQAGPTEAQLAYLGSPFVVNKTFAMKFGESWLILSAKFGFMEPTFIIPGPYNVTFSETEARPISIGELAKQVKQSKLDRFETIVGLGSKEYLAAIRGAFVKVPSRLRFPFMFPMFEANRRISAATKSGKTPWT